MGGMPDIRDQKTHDSDDQIMAVYAITGKLGSGKGKGAMKLLRDYLRAGKRVATNCDVFLEHMMPAQSRQSVIRVPDKPAAADLYAIGSGNRYIDFEPVVTYTPGALQYTPPAPRLLPGFDEAHNGALFLDECASWLNTRNFQDKGRADLLEWAIHARKYGWDVFFICQNISQVDKQLRDSLFEYVVRMSRLDRMKVPVLSAVTKLMTAGFSNGSLPRMHVGVVRLGCSTDGIVADRWFFRGDDLNNAYNTTQVFSDSYPHSIHSILPSWHLQARAGLVDGFVGPVRPFADFELLQPRPRPPKPPHKHMIKFLTVALVLGMSLGAAGHWYARSIAPVEKPAAVAHAERKFSDIVGRGYYQVGGVVFVILSDGRVIPNPASFKRIGGSWEAEVTPGVWVRGVAQ